ncbi:MAG: hypothetical protein HQL84_13080 [Magnetococcales bacterium]|nr:hypothetical protein [Magnetococcales bacterium]MBF0150967.1 hypothetical protein [Magnetococcales bacterium]MBF0172127.1 hypothetical protein [Magnetococcales bacterium]
MDESVAFAMDDAIIAMTISVASNDLKRLFRMFPSFDFIQYTSGILFTAFQPGFNEWMNFSFALGSSMEIAS